MNKQNPFHAETYMHVCIYVCTYACMCIYIKVGGSSRSHIQKEHFEIVPLEVTNILKFPSRTRCVGLN